MLLEQSNTSALPHTGLQTAYLLLHTSAISQGSIILSQEGRDDNKVVTTNRLTKAFGWTSINRGLQQDVHEFMQTLFNSLEKELHPHDFHSLSSLFAGKVQRDITCDKVGYKSRKTENIMGLSLSTASHINTERSLASMFKSEQLEMTIEGQGRQTVELSSSLTALPKVLLLTLNRLTYDPTEQAVVKVTDHFEYRESLELSGYTYTLHSAVVHEGGAESGHYYCYISPQCDHTVWYRFNDAEVVTSDATSAIRENYGKRSCLHGPTAYLLTYIRTDCGEEFFRPKTVDIPESLRVRINDVKNVEQLRQERLRTAHLYTTVSLVPWTMLHHHSGYDVCDRLSMDDLHKQGEGAQEAGLVTVRVMKTSTVAELVTSYDSSMNESNCRLWAFTDRESADGWAVHRPDKLVKCWTKTIAEVSQMKCPFYLFMEKVGVADHPTILSETQLSAFVKIYSKNTGRVSLELHLILDIDITIGDLKYKILQLCGLEDQSGEGILYQEFSSMSTVAVHCEDSTELYEALDSHLLRHGTVFILEVSGVPKSTGSITPSSHSDSSSSAVSAKQDGRSAADYMRRLGNKVTVSWYNKERKYTPSQDGDFTLPLSLDMTLCDVTAMLANHLHCGSRQLRVFEARRDQGYPQLSQHKVYDSLSSNNLLAPLYKQVQHSPLWRHAAVLFYQQLPMSIEEMEVRHTLSCLFVSQDLLSVRTITLYPLKQKSSLTDSQNSGGSETGEDSPPSPTTVSYLLQLARKELCLDHPLRLLSVSGKRISKICKEDHLISSLLKEELRLEEIPESEEDIEMEFTKVLASVVLDSAYLARRGVSTHPFLLVVDRSDAGDVIRNKICERLKITDDWKHKMELKLVIPGKVSTPLPDGKLAVRDWANLAYDDDTGSYEGCNYIKITDRLQVTL
ncbi:USP7 [Bugula neritina]|uniref:USP7 n=1 Tax=Bugula neritina TaxID=10212 RepID=A0A7J7KAS8_BUGNE|nr:USP7 [Bugula neritina]